MNTTMNAGDNPALANDLLAKALTPEDTTPEPAKIVPPSSIQVDLPGGYITSTGEVCRTATVRELNGKDEEAINRSGSNNKVFGTILQRGTLTLGEESATEAMLDSLLVGDRDAITLGIYRATFGDTAELGAWCGGCGDQKVVQVDVLQDIKTKVLIDSINDRTFTVKGRSQEFVVTLPTGKVQKRLIAAIEENPSEATTILLEGTVLAIDGRQVLSKTQVQNLGIMDRRLIADEISKRTPGPQFEDLAISCPDCEGEVSVPISLGTLFRF